MWVVAVTGGIGSGKSTVAELFGKYGVPSIDTDTIARDLVQPGSPLLEEIVAQFGPGFVKHDGTLDRKALREHVFSNEADRRRLESLLHPAIRESVLAQLENLNAVYCLLLIPLLANNPDHYPHDRVLFIDTEEHIRIDRSVKRDSQSTDTIKRIMASQPSREKMLAIADDVLDNSGDLDQLSANVDVLHQKYLRLARDESS